MRKNYEYILEGCFCHNGGSFFWSHTGSCNGSFLGGRFALWRSHWILRAAYNGTVAHSRSSQAGLSGCVSLATQERMEDVFSRRIALWHRRWRSIRYVWVWPIFLIQGL